MDELQAMARKFEAQLEACIIRTVQEKGNAADDDGAVIEETRRLMCEAMNVFITRIKEHGEQYRRRCVKFTHKEFFLSMHHGFMDWDHFVDFLTFSDNTKAHLKKDFRDALFEQDPLRLELYEKGRKLHLECEQERLVRGEKKALVNRLKHPNIR